MKLDNGAPRSTSGERPSRERVRRATPLQGNPLPRTPLPRTALPRTALAMEWMDPMSWRLPSGKALAEFALQSGFLAPLMFGSSLGGGVRSKAAGEKRPLQEVPGSTGSFRGAGQIRKAGEVGQRG